MINVEQAEQSNLFEDIYIHVLKAWHMDKVFSFRKKIPTYLQKIFLLKFNKTVDGIYFNKEFDKFNLIIIKDENPAIDFITESGIYIDTFIINCKENIVVVINEDIMLPDKETDISTLLCQIGSICIVFKYVMSSIEKLYPCDKDSTLCRQFSYAPIIMTFKLVTSLYQHKELGPELIMKKYFTIFSRNYNTSLLKQDHVKSCYSYTIYDLLDRLGILLIVDGFEDRFKEYLEAEDE